jgi:hypothetical protein
MIASSSQRGINNLTELRSFTDSNNNDFINNDDATVTAKIVPLSPNFRSLFLHGVITITHYYCNSQQSRKSCCHIWELYMRFCLLKPTYHHHPRRPTDRNQYNICQKTVFTKVKVYRKMRVCVL